MHHIYLPLPELYRQCCADFIKCNVEHHTRNEADKTFVRTKYIDCLLCNISIRVHGVICSIILRRLLTFLLSSQNNLMKGESFLWSVSKIIDLKSLLKSALTGKDAFDISS